MKNVVLISLGGAALLWLVRRLWLKPKLTKESWAIYRAPQPLQLDVEELVKRLGRYGYDAVVVDDAERAPSRIVLRQRNGRHGGVIIDLRPLAEGGYGTVDAKDAVGELYAEMAKFAMLELGRLLPGITYRGDTSALTPESTDTLEPMLPDRPRALR